MLDNTLEQIVEVISDEVDPHLDEDNEDSWLSGAFSVATALLYSVKYKKLNYWKGVIARLKEFDVNTADLEEIIKGEDDG